MHMTWERTPQANSSVQGSCQSGLSPSRPARPRDHPSSGAAAVTLEITRRFPQLGVWSYKSKIKASRERRKRGSILSHHRDSTVPEETERGKSHPRATPMLSPPFVALCHNSPGHSHTSKACSALFRPPAPDHQGALPGLGLPCFLPQEGSALSCLQEGRLEGCPLKSQHVKLSCLRELSPLAKK